MPNTYTQLYIQYVFAVKHRETLIKEPIRVEVQKYLSGIVRNNKHKLLSIYCMPDHTHVFLGLNPSQSISSLANDLKTNTSRWINEKQLCQHKFNWQDGYGAFSYHKSLVPVIGNYVDTQNTHHQRRTFKEEYLDLLREFDVEYDDRYLFDFFE